MTTMAMAARDRDPVTGRSGGRLTCWQSQWGWRREEGEETDDSFLRMRMRRERRKVEARDSVA